MSENERKLTCWAVSDGKAGMENQCIGLAESMGLSPEIKRIHLKSPWRQLTPFLSLGCQYAFSNSGDSINAPWPDVLIASGRQSTAASLAVRKLSGGKTFTIQIQNPQIRAKNFSAVIVPEHDHLEGENIYQMRGALHKVTTEKLQEAAAQAEPKYVDFPQDKVAVLIGGNNGVYALTPDIMADVAEKLSALAQTHNIGLLVTPSRRTGADNIAILKAHLQDLPNVEIWDGTGENPYFAYLGLAKWIIVTCDSVSMATEACSTGKPVYVIKMKGGAPKFEEFHASLEQSGMTRIFEGALEEWEYPALDDNQRLATLLLKKIAEHRQGFNL